MKSPEEIKSSEISKNSESWIDSEIDRLTELMRTLDMTSQAYQMFKKQRDDLQQQKDDNSKSSAEKQKEQYENAADAVGKFGDAFSAMGSNLEMPELNIAGTIAQAVATMLMGYTQATAQAAKFGPIAWAAYAATGLAQVMGIVGAIKSAGSYADGGIIGGNSFAGDRLYARVNSGEMILNTSQQSRLFNMLNGGSLTANGRSNRLEFKLKGSTLKAATGNYDKRMNKIK